MKSLLVNFNIWRAFVSRNKSKRLKNEIAESYNGDRTIHFVAECFSRWWQSARNNRRKREAAHTANKFHRSKVISRSFHIWLRAFSHVQRVYLVEAKYCEKVLRRYFDAMRAHAEHQRESRRILQDADHRFMRFLRKTTFLRWKFAVERRREKRNYFEEVFAKVFTRACFGKWKDFVQHQRFSAVVQKHTKHLRTKRFFVRWKIAFEEAERLRSVNELKAETALLFDRRRLLKSHFARMREFLNLKRAKKLNNFFTVKKAFSRWLVQLGQRKRTKYLDSVNLFLESRRRASLLQRCFLAWKLHVDIEKKLQLVFTQGATKRALAVRKRVFDAWRRYKNEAATSRASDETKLTQWKQRSLRTYFFRWAQAFSEALADSLEEKIASEHCKNLLHRYFERWKTSYERRRRALRDSPETLAWKSPIHKTSAKLFTENENSDVVLAVAHHKQVLLEKAFSLWKLALRRSRVTTKSRKDGS
eukprot:TRINITY_DN9064_c0_g1_i1.p1 TRINITY_DN9064_c0_g1~~TRINITY_DN9064_c0_g1_i1.p1  ORF type:complete len:475 (+),score=75.05 TRINITY_DN9064_c0_g1_i1:1-1425(+)